MIVKTQQVTTITRMEYYKPEDIRTSFKKMIEKNSGKLTAAEVGVYEGINAKMMLLYHPEMRLFLVDDWENLVVFTGGPKQPKEFGDILKVVTQANLYPFESKVVYMNKNSKDASKEFTDEYFDYVYIDGDHSYSAVKEDIDLWWPKVKTGGMLAGHDVAMIEVRYALDEFLTREKLQDKSGRDEPKDGRSDWWVEK